MFGVWSSGQEACGLSLAAFSSQQMRQPVGVRRPRRRSGLPQRTVAPTASGQLVLEDATPLAATPPTGSVYLRRAPQSAAFSPFFPYFPAHGGGGVRCSLFSLFLPDGPPSGPQLPDAPEVVKESHGRTRTGTDAHATPSSNCRRGVPAPQHCGRDVSVPRSPPFSTPRSRVGMQCPGRSRIPSLYAGARPEAGRRDAGASQTWHPDGPVGRVQRGGNHPPSPSGRGGPPADARLDTCLFPPANHRWLMKIWPHRGPDAPASLHAGPAQGARGTEDRPRHAVPTPERGDERRFPSGREADAWQPQQGRKPYHRSLKRRAIGF